MKLLDEIPKKRQLSNLINAYCDDLRSDVKLTADEVILQVNDLSTQLKEEIDEKFD